MSFIGSLFFPQENACHFCGRFLDTGTVCVSCLKRLMLLRIAGETCPPSPVLHHCAAAFHHKGLARQMVHKLKYQHDAALAALMGEHMAAVLGDFSANIILPVPLHPQREWERGYNQAELLAREVSSHTSIRMETGVLIRTRFTSTQVGRSREERLQAMRGAFDVQKPEMVRGKRILLVDDVLTTGATAIACAEALKRAGAKETALLVFGRA